MRVPRSFPGSVNNLLALGNERDRRPVTVRPIGQTHRQTVEEDLQMCQRHLPPETAVGNVAEISHTNRGQVQFEDGLLGRRVIRRWEAPTSLANVVGCTPLRQSSVY